MTDNTCKPLYFLFHGNIILLHAGQTGIDALPRDLGPYAPDKALNATAHSLGTYRTIPCFALELPAIPQEGNGFALPDLRGCYDILGEDLYRLAGKGFELIHWDRQSRFCPVCGSATKLNTAISKLCPSCGNEMFPSISVATIVLVQRGDEALLVRGRNFRGNNYGLVAGFLEPGETLEECLAREIREETALEVDNVRYFGSQPWPYPSGLMVGFTAEYTGGEITLQEEELVAAAFFSRDALPELPARLSIARRLIESWVAR